MSQFAQTLSSLLKSRRLTLAEVSRNTGIPVSTLSEWCSGREPKLNGSLLKLCHYLGVTLDYLAEGKDRSHALDSDVLSLAANEGVDVLSGDFRIKIERLRSK